MAPASISVTNGTCFQTKVMTMPRQSSRLAVCDRVEQAGGDERVVHEPVLGEESAHALRRDDEGDEQRPAVEPAQRRDQPWRLAERQLAGDGDRDQRDQRRRDEDDEEREADVGGVELERLLEVPQRRTPRPP